MRKLRMIGAFAFSTSAGAQGEPLRPIASWVVGLSKVAPDVAHIAVMEAWASGLDDLRKTIDAKRWR
ncbi:hypothetical protein [Aureimonas jatrophae]|uniref:hypothetical protein n=1 Tax=Aureimonas jatrophae TaxID=1166073 RepID=UPI000B80E556|nr:hypothetical protein [Aureimonas jatrophae]MBB3952371.1 hypothetical protein [Aureimonas jatrophae]